VVDYICIDGKHGCKYPTNKEVGGHLRVEFNGVRQNLGGIFACFAVSFKIVVRKLVLIP